MSRRAWCLFVVLLAMAPGVLQADEDPASPGIDSGSLEIEISGLKSGVGQVRIAVFDSEEEWLGAAVHAKVVDLESTECRWIVEEIPPGEYGIAVFHDLNENGKNDRNLLGIPKEPYGFSNDARASFGPPKWSKARFSVVTPSTTIRIQVK